MAISVHTNTAALVALQNLNSTNEKLTEAQSRISTGLKIKDAKDNAAVWTPRTTPRSGRSRRTREPRSGRWRR